MATRVNIGVIGAGGIAFRKTIPGMPKARNCRLIAVMDPVGVNRIAAAFGVSKAYTEEHDLLADPEVQAVYIASPAACHRDQIVRAAEAGKHVLCEKPLCLNLKQAKEAVAACRKHKVMLQEGYMMKFHGAHAKIKEMIDAGRIGKVVSMRAQLSCWYPRIDGAWQGSQDRRRRGPDRHGHPPLRPSGVLRRSGATRGRAGRHIVQDYKSDDASTTLLEFQSGLRPRSTASTAFLTRPAARG